MHVELKRSNSKKTLKVEVSSWEVASIAVQTFIQDHDLGAGCSDGAPAFTGGKVFEGSKQIGRISYNGRCWNMDDKLINVLSGEVL